MLLSEELIQDKRVFLSDAIVQYVCFIEAYIYMTLLP